MTESEEDIVHRFADAFLDASAQARLRQPLETGYDWAFDGMVWGQILIDELHVYSKLAHWLDFKFNVLTLMQDDDWDNLVGKLFVMHGAADLTADERAPLVAKGLELINERHVPRFFPDIQPLAKMRGLRLMLADNFSDGQLLFALPDDQADAWHLTAIGDVLLFDAAHVTVNDPRSGGAPLAVGP